MFVSSRYSNDHDGFYLTALGHQMNATRSAMKSLGSQTSARTHTRDVLRQGARSFDVMPELSAQNNLSSDDRDPGASLHTLLVTRQAAEGVEMLPEASQQKRAKWDKLQSNPFVELETTHVCC